MTAAKKGDNVKIHYTGTLNDGSVFDSSIGRTPLSFRLGSGQVIQGFDEAVLGMRQGEAKTVVIPVEKAYGPRKEELVISVPRQHVPPEITPEVGLKLQMGGANGELVMVEIIEVADDYIALDANPPLAGQELTFQIDLVAIN